MISDPKSRREWISLPGPVVASPARAEALQKKCHYRDNKNYTIHVSTSYFRHHHHRSLPAPTHLSHPIHRLYTLLPHRHLRAHLILTECAASLACSTVHIRLAFNLELKSKVRRVRIIEAVPSAASAIVFFPSSCNTARRDIALVSGGVYGVACRGTEISELVRVRACAGIA
jgi:hypothetical protein